MTCRYTCILPDHGHTFNDEIFSGEVIRAVDVHDAAHQYVETNYSEWEYPQGPIIVLVRADDDDGETPPGVVTEIVVEVGMEPVFRTHDGELHPRQCTHSLVFKDGVCHRCSKPGLAATP